MFALLCFVLAVLAAPFKSKSRLEAENVALRHQLIVLRLARPLARSLRPSMPKAFQVPTDASGALPRLEVRSIEARAF